MNWCQSFLERNVFERKKKLSIKKSCLQDEACLRIKPESPKAYYDTLIHMFECSQKSSDNLPAPNLHPAARHWAVLFFTHRLVSGHVYEVNMAITSWSPFLSIRKSKYQRDMASKMTQLCCLIRTSHSSRSLGGTGYFLRWNRQGKFEH